MKPNKPTRRALVAGLAVAPLAGVPTIAGAIPMSVVLTQAIARHKAAWAARCVDGLDDDAANDLCHIERAALDDLVELLVASDAELLSKLRYLLAYERELTGDVPEISHEWLSVVVALDRHMIANLP